MGGDYRGGSSFKFDCGAARHCLGVQIVLAHCLIDGCKEGNKKWYEETRGSPKIIGTKDPGLKLDWESELHAFKTYLTLIPLQY